MRNVESIGYFLAGGAIVIAANFGTDQGPKVIHAAENTPTPAASPTKTPVPTGTPTETPTVTATPDALGTQIASARKELDDVKKRKEQEKELENIKKETGYLLGTPRPQPTLTPTPTPDPDLITIKREDFNTVIKTGVDTALAARPSPTPVIIRERVVERVVEERDGGGGGGTPGILWMGLAAIGGSLAFARRQQIRDLIIQSGAPNWRVVNWVRTHGGERVIQSAPVQFAWRQVRRLYGV